MSLLSRGCCTGLYAVAYVLSLPDGRQACRRISPATNIYVSHDDELENSPELVEGLSKHQLRRFFLPTRSPDTSTSSVLSGCGEHLQGRKRAFGDAITLL